MASIISVDYACLMSALAIADADGSRIRASDFARVIEFQTAHDLDIGALQRWAMEHLPESKIALIESGLMTGAYAYSLVTKAAAVCVPGPRSPASLPVHEGMVFDVAMSYSSEDRDDRVLPLLDALRERGVRVYVLDVAKDPEDPIWSIRFRHSMFRAHYLVPILSAHYFLRAGTARELREMARLTVEHRRSEFFYPLIALVDPAAPGLLPPHVEREAGPIDASFAWTHIFGLPWDLDADELARFFRSLGQNAEGTWDPDFLRILAPQLTAVRWGEIEAGPVSEVYFAHPTLTHYAFLVGPDGTTRFMGVHEPPAEAIAAKDRQALMERVIERVGSGMRSEVREPAPDYDTAPDPFQQVIAANQLVKRGEHEAALRTYVAAAGAGESSAMTWHGIGVCHRAAGQPALAHRAFTEAATLGRRTGVPGHVVARYGADLASVAANADPSLGLEAVLVAAAPPPADHGFRTDICEFEAPTRQALEIIRRPGGIQDRLAAAEAAHQRGDPAFAVELLHATVNFAVSLKSRSDALYLAALLLAEQGLHDDARRHLRWALHCNAENDAARRLLQTLVNRRP